MTNYFNTTIGLSPTSVQERVEMQLIHWRGLGVIISDEQWEQILQRADEFESFTDTDEPFVSGGFGYNDPTELVKKLFRAFTPQRDYTKSSHIEDAELRYVSGMKPAGELRLIHYDSNACQGLSPEDARKAAEKDGLRLAGIEVFEYLMLKPSTGFAWDGKLHCYPYASGLDLKYGSGSYVPYLSRWGGALCEFYLDSDSADCANDEWSSPVVREC